MTEHIQSEWSHKIEAEDIGKTPTRTTISASPQERKDLAVRLGVDSVDLLEAQLVMKRESGNRMVHVEGAFKGRVTQTCVVTLEPVVNDIEGDVEGWFANPDAVVSLARVRHEKRGRAADAELPILEEKDDPEPIVDGQIDLGDLVTQFLALAIDPYPHKEGVVFEQGDDSRAAEDAGPSRQNPFAALKDWKAGKNKEN